MLPLSNNPTRSPLGVSFRSPLGVNLRFVKYTMTMAFVSLTIDSGGFTFNSFNSYKSTGGSDRWDADITRWNQKTTSLGIPELYCEVDLYSESFASTAYRTYSNGPGDIDYVYVMNPGILYPPSLAENYFYAEIYDAVLDDNFYEYGNPSAPDDSFYNPSGNFTARPVPLKVRFLIEDSPNMDRDFIATQLNYLESYLTAQDIDFEEIIYTTTEDSDPAQGRWLRWFCDL